MYAKVLILLEHLEPYDVIEIILSLYEIAILLLGIEADRNPSPEYVEWKEKTKETPV